MSGDPVLDHADELGLVVGLKHVGPSVARLDIDVLLDKEPETFNLFLIALKELQDEPDWDTKLMSFFQIAGMTVKLLRFSQTLRLISLQAFMGSQT
jgi:hypothetical protein